MANFFRLIILLVTSGSAAEAQENVIPSAEEWFRATYAPLYQDKPWDRADELEYDLLNDSTASFKVKWRDFYSGGNIAYECSWYLADFNDCRWLITEFAIIDCADHGL